MEPVFPAIVCVGYNRPNALLRLLDSMGRAGYPEGSIPLVISIDKSDRQQEVRAVAEDFLWPHGEKTVRCFDTRQGLRQHILQCGDLTKQYGAIILLEDDLVVSPGFYNYAAKALAYYGSAKEICGVALYSHAWNGYGDFQFMPQNNGYDTYLGQFSVTWGQCWTSSQWQGFRAWYADHSHDGTAFDERLPADVIRWPETSWGKYFAAYITAMDLYYVMPYVALSTNDEEAGQHAAGGDNAHQVMLLSAADMAYRFAPVTAAIRYDMFFERMNLPLPEGVAVDGAEVCVNLHGQKKSTLHKRYMLSTCTYALPVVASFGLRLRPIEANVVYSVPGDSIRLYDAKEGLPPPSSFNTYERMAYETYRLGWRRLLKYGLTDCAKKLCGRAKRIFHIGG